MKYSLRSLLICLTIAVFFILAIQYFFRTERYIDSLDLPGGYRVVLTLDTSSDSKGGTFWRIRNAGEQMRDRQYFGSAVTERVDEIELDYFSARKGRLFAIVESHYPNVVLGVIDLDEGIRETAGSEKFYALLYELQKENAKPELVSSELIAPLKDRLLR